MSQQPVDFTGLLDAFLKVLELAFAKRDAKILRDAYDSFTANSDHDKKSPMDQAFRELLLFRLREGEDLANVGDLVRFSVDAVRLEIVSVTIPVVLLGDIFETVTLDKCERIFGFVEDMVEVWKEDIFFSSCKNNILRMCNDMLRRLSRAQNTIFCGRILLFLSKFFPFSERSGLNIVSEFNLDNVTDYGVDKDLDDALEDTVEDIPIKIDYNLYCKFWSLQDFFRNPNQCYSKAQWKMFQTHADTILEAFSSFKLEEQRSSAVTNGNVHDNIDVQDYQHILDMDVDMIACVVPKKDKSSEVESASSIRKTDNFFAKFLTNPKLLALQLSDSNFRRSLLVQFLILFQYLQLTVKFKTESNTLTQAQSDFIKETESKVYRLLEETPPNGARFALTVRHMLGREEMWNNWKNEGCKEFKKPDETEVLEAATIKPPPAKRAKPTLGDSLRDANRNGKFYLGNDVLTRLWNYSPDNLQACKSEERNFLPQLEAYLENPHEKKDTSFEWRALRLLARQSPHFFVFTNSPSYKVADYLENVRRRIIKDKLDSAKAALGSNVINNAETVGSSTIGESNEQETVALQEQEADAEGDGDLGDDDNEDKNTRRISMTASLEQIEEIAPLIGDDWKKLGKKLGFEASELRDFEASHPERDGGCITMLVNWFQDDEDATLENWAYMLEGLKMDAAAKAVNALIQRLSAQNETKAQVTSD